MTRTQIVALAAALSAAIVGTVVFLQRDELLVSFHQHRLAAEIDAWRRPPAAGEIKDYGDYSAVEDQLSKLVALNALDRVELQVRLYTDGATAPLPSVDRLRNGQNPAPVFHHVKGDPRIQPQTVVIWCEPGDTIYWRQFAASTLSEDGSSANHPMQPSGEVGRFEVDYQPSPPADR